MNPDHSLKFAEKPLKTVCFGAFTFDPVSGELRNGAEPVPLRPQASSALSFLISRAGELVSHKDLGTEIWGDASVSWKDGMHQIIRDLRKALGDDPKNPVFIETINRRGYRFHMTQKTAPPITAPHGWFFSLKMRDAFLFGGGALSIPVMIVAACIAIGFTEPW